MKKDRIYHIISNTHWDREWRFPFQRNRKMLVDMIDAVIHILETEPEYRAFHLDSQSIVLKDYLEIKPQNKQRIIDLVKDKRLFIGPWYILPDEFQVGGENLVRNLLLGHKVCKENGGVSKVGYSPFSWGQISQLPQIYKGFNIDVIMFYRGVNSLDSEKAEFIWEGADGTRALTSRFSTMPRYNFYFYIYRPVVHDETPFDVEYKWTRGGTPFHIADTSIKEDYYILNPVDLYKKENVKSSVDKIIQDQAEDFTTENVIWMEGHDSSGPNIKTVDIIKDIKNEFSKLNVIHSTLENYSNMLKESADLSNLPVVKGERRSAQFDRRSGNMFAYTLSARMDIKQLNFDAERSLQYYAEPFNTLAGLYGLDINDKYIDTAWEFLIQNSAHDSIGGCSLDGIHDDMIFRYKQVKEISDAVYERALKYFISNLNTSEFGNSKKPENNIYLTVFNPLPSERTENISVNLDIPKELAKASFSIEDVNGNEIEYQIIDKKDEEPVLEQMIDRPMYLSMKRYKVEFEAKDVPALGYKVFKVLPEAKDKKFFGKVGKISNNLVVLENEHLKIKVNNNGTLSLTHKASKSSYHNLCYLYDEGEAGHAWVHTQVTPIITSLKEEPVIELIENGNLYAKCKVSYNLKVPKSVEVRSSTKSNTKVSLPIEVYYKLNKNSKTVEVKIKLNNTAYSHRLRVMMPFGIKGKYSFGEGQFDIVKRSTERHDTTGWIEQPMYDYPMHHFAGIEDKEHGAAVFVDGLKEYEVLDDANSTFAVTLFRGFNYVIQPSSKEDYSTMKGPHCLGEHEYNFAIYPYNGDLYKAKVFNESYNFNYRLRCVEHGESYGDLPVNHSFITLKGNLVLSAFKESEDKSGFVVRIFNPGEKEIKGSIEFSKNISTAQLCSLEELPIAELSVKDNQISLSAKPKEILTIKVK